MFGQPLGHAWEGPLSISMNQSNFIWKSGACFETSDSIQHNMYVLYMHLFAYWDKLQTILQSFCLLKKEPGAKDWGLTPLHWEKGRTSCACAVNSVPQDETRSRHTAENWPICPLATWRRHFLNHSSKITFWLFSSCIIIGYKDGLHLTVAYYVNKITKSQEWILMIFGGKC